MPTPTNPNIPLSYTVPSFPSLYWPINTPAGASYYLYYQTDIWRFTLYWTLIAYGAVHLATSGWAVIVWVRHVLGLEDTPGGYVGSVKAFGEALGKGYSHSHSRGDGSIEMRDRNAGTAPARTTATTQDRRESAVTDGTGSTRSRSRERVRPTKQKGSKRSKARSLKWVWVIPLVYCTIGSIEALMAGSIVGVV